MPWPMAQDYNEAIQNPAHCFADPELQPGEAVTNAMGIPIPCSGNFANVYAFTAGPRKWAIKCFTREIPGLKERYAAVSQYLQQVPLPFMVDFRFLEQGIRVRGQWFPVLKMQWVEGLPLNAFVRENLDKPQVLDALCQIWVKLASRLREANLAHCDLQHGNVLMVQGSSAGKLGVKLVDYDGMCVPALELLKSIEVGHPAYQHPQRLREHLYGMEVDRFSHLVIYTALRALMVGGKALWQKYDNGDNLLFRQADLAAPRNSAVFRELLHLNSAEVKKLTQALAIASANPMDKVPLLEQLVEVPKPPPAEAAITAAASRQAGAERATSPALQSFALEKTPVVRQRKSNYRPRQKRGLALAAVAATAFFALVAAGAIFVMGRGGSSSKATEMAQAATEKTRSTPKVEATQPSTRPSTKKRSKNNDFDLGEIVPKFDPPPQPEPPPTPKPEPKTETKPEPKPEPKAEPKPQPTPNPTPGNPWNHLDVSNATAMDGFLRLAGPGGKVQTKAAFSGPVEITVVARTNELHPRRQNIRLNAYDGSQVIFNWELNPRQLRVHRPDRRLGTAPLEPLAPNTWYTLKWRITAKTIEVLVDGKVVYSDTPRNPNDFVLSANRPISVTNFFGSVVDIREFRVESGEARPKTDPATVEKPKPKTDTAPQAGVSRGHTGKVTGVLFSPDAKHIASASQDKTVRQWDAASGKESGRYAGPNDEVLGLAPTPDGRSFCAFTKITVNAWDFASRSPAYDFGQFNKFNELRQRLRPTSFAGVFFDPGSGPRMITGNTTGGLDAVAFRVGGYGYRGFGGGLNRPVTTLAGFSDGKRCVSGFADGSMIVWDIKVERPTSLRDISGHKGAVRCLAVSLDGKEFVSGGADGTVRLWDTETGDELRQFQGHDGEVLGVALSRDGSRLVTCGQDKTVRLWNTRTAQQIRKFAGHTDAITCVAVSPDGKTAASGSADQTVRLWQLPP